MMEARDLGLWIATLVLTLVLAPLIGRFVLGPVNRAAGRLHAPTRFLLMDFVWLLVQLQLALGFTLQYIGVQYPAPFGMMIGFLSFASILMWAGGVSFLSRSGVRDIWRRGMFLVVLMPATLALMVIAPLLPSLAYLMQTDPQIVVMVLRLKDNLPKNSGLWLAGASLVAVPLTGYCLYRLSAWMVRGVEPPLGKPLTT